MRERRDDELRPLSFRRGFTKYAEGSVLVSAGDTRVLCTATPGVPRFLTGKGEGWVTAEYGLLPRSTGTRCDREAVKGKQSGRTQEIQRLIGRSLRAVVDLSKMKDISVCIDCDVIQADGGTRTASITGGFVALYLAMEKLVARKKLEVNPIREFVAAVSCDIFAGEKILDVDYEEDSHAQVDMNFVLTESGKIVEIQGTAEELPFAEEDFGELMALAKEGIKQLIAEQKKVLGVK